MDRSSEIIDRKLPTMTQEQIEASQPDEWVFDVLRRPESYTGDVVSTATAAHEKYVLRMMKLKDEVVRGR